MDICPFEPGEKKVHLIYNGDEDLMILDRLPQEGIGAVYLRTSEIGGEPWSAILYLDEDDIAELNDWRTEDLDELKGSVTSILTYAKTHPLPLYLFFLWN